VRACGARDACSCSTISATRRSARAGESPECAEWQRLVARVAACGNTRVKWSAMFENAGRALAADEARPWFEWCLACFGASRTMWGSNWPVCFADARGCRSGSTRCATHRRRAVAATSRPTILGGNAVRVYRL
jgi:L-fuconolactonase